MKWLLLLAIIACGKHQMPNSTNTKDSDGDYLLDQNETGLNKYIANIENFTDIQGHIQVDGDFEGKVFFSNSAFAKGVVMKQLIGNGVDGDAEYFKEWSELVFEPMPKSYSSSKSKIITLYFKTQKSISNELFLLNGKNTRNLGHFSNVMNFSLTEEEFLSLQKGVLKLAFKKSRQENANTKINEDLVSQKTYKVFIHDGTSSNILYVSKELPLDEFMRYKKIKSTTILTDENLFFDSHAQGTSDWYQRDLKNGDVALVYSSIQNIKKSFLKKFQKKTFILARENGNPINKLSIVKPSVSNIYLRIRPKRLLRNFVEKNVDRSYPGFELTVCVHTMRESSGEYEMNSSITDFFSYLDFPLTDYELNFKEQTDQLGDYWEIILATRLENISLSLRPLPESTYITTGQINITCTQPGISGSRKYRTSPESKLTYEIESFVEKVQ